MSQDTTCPNGLCEGPCVCAELDQFLSDVASTSVVNACYMQIDMFDVGIGQAMMTGEKIVNVFIHQPGTDPDTDPSTQIMSFGRVATHRLISLLIRGYKANWETDNDES